MNKRGKKNHHPNNKSLMYARHKNIWKCAVFKIHYFYNKIYILREALKKTNTNVCGWCVKTKTEEPKKHQKV